MHASLASIGRIATIQLEDDGEEEHSDDSDDQPTPRRTNIDEDDEDEDKKGRHFPTLSPEDLRQIVEQSEGRFIFLRPWQIAISQVALPKHKMTETDAININCTHSPYLHQSATQLAFIIRQESLLNRIEARRQIGALIKEFESFCVTLQNLLQEETALLYRCRTGEVSCDASCDDNNGMTPGGGASKLAYLRSTCDQLRLCLNHVGSLSSSSSSQPQRSPSNAHYNTLLTSFVKRHYLLTSMALSTTHALITTGLAVLAHSNMARYTHDDLWEISRGIEEFNIILEDIQDQRQHKLFRRSLVIRQPASLFNYLQTSVDNVDLLRPISFTHILSRLAKERSINIVDSFHYFLTTSKDVLKLFKHRNLCGLSVESLEPGAKAASRSRRQSDLQTVPSASLQNESNSRSSAHQTSSDSPDLSNPDPGSSHTSPPTPSNHQDQGTKRSPFAKATKLVSRIKRLGSPLDECVRHEYNFASAFLSVLSQSTELLRGSRRARSRPSWATESSTGEHRPTAKLTKLETLDLLPTPSGPTPEELLSTLSSATSDQTPRKVVQWSDKDDLSLRHRVLSLYLDLVWSSSASILEEAFVCDGARLKWWHQLPSVCSREAAKSRLGSLFLFSPGALIFLAAVIKGLANTDMFPSGFLQILLNQSQQIKMTAITSLWDHYFCASLSESRLSKVVPVALPRSSVFSTGPTRLLLDALDPLTEGIKAFMDATQELVVKGDKNTPPSVLSPYLSHLLLSLHLLSVSAHQCHSWIHSLSITPSTPTHHLLFLIHADLRLLSEALYRCRSLLRPLKSLSTSLAWQNPDHEKQTCFHQITKLTESLAHLDALFKMLKTTHELGMTHYTGQCIALANSLVPSQMPTGRCWRIKTPPIASSSQTQSTSHWSISSANHNMPNHNNNLLPTNQNKYSASDDSVSYFSPQAYAIGWVTQLFQSVSVEIIDKLHATSQVAVIRPPIDALCGSWHKYILKERIKFSYWGARQLEADVHSIRLWILHHVTNPEAQAALFVTSSLMDLEGGVKLVLMQTSSGGAKPGTFSNLGCGPGSSTNVVQEHVKHSRDDLSYMTTRNEWLALRLTPEEGRRLFPICH